MSNSLVKDSVKLRDGLKSRWKELKMTQVAVALDAQSRGQRGIIRPAINKYLKDPYAKGSLNESQIVWLAWRWLVPVTLAVGIPESNVKYTIPKEFDEKKALKLLNKMLS